MTAPMPIKRRSRKRRSGCSPKSRHEINATPFAGGQQRTCGSVALNPQRLRSGNSPARECSQTGFAALNDFQRIESFSSGISITFSFTASPIHSRNSCFVPATATG